MTAITDQIAAQAQALTEAMRSSCADPTDAITLLGSLVALASPASAASDLFRRAAVASMALATADYQPASSTEANLMIQRVGGLLDTEIVTAADNGEIASFNALRSLRQAVIADLRARSATLPQLVTVNLPGNLPSLVLAYRLYQDTSREPGLVARTTVLHPGFMPASFEALST